MAVKVFKTLRTLRSMERKLLPFMKTIEDRDIVLEIGYHAEIKVPLGVKQLHQLRIASEGTIGRRLKRLKSLGVVREQRSSQDRRNILLTLDPKIHAAWRRIQAAK